MSPPGASLRAEAARTLAAVLGQRRSLKAVLSEVLPGIADPRDRALLEAICFGALRHRRRYEAVLSAWLPRSLPARDYPVHCLLLAGLAQLDALGLPAHAAVAATAEATRTLARPALVGLVNAVLRRATREAWPGSDEPAVRESYPDWLAQSLRRDWPERWPDVLAAGNRPAPLWLRIDSRRRSRDPFLAELAAKDLAASAPDWPPAAVRIEASLPPEALPGWREGDIAVQDAAAQLAVLALAPKAGERVLDACAAPGGKAAQIAEALADDGQLLALDSDPRRLENVGKTLVRMRLASPRVQLRAADAGDTDAWWDGAPFDAILLDAPCSATGIIRRQPDIKWHRRPGDIPTLVAEQARLLDALWPTLAPGGRLLYATCSLLKDENETQVARFLERHPDAEAQPLPDAYGHRAGAGRQRFPGEDGMDGFFYALLAKRR